MIIVNVTSADGTVLDRFEVVEAGTPEFREVSGETEDIEAIGMPMGNAHVIERLMHSARIA
jgi:hypothetical protein